MVCCYLLCSTQKKTHRRPCFFSQLHTKHMHTQTQTHQTLENISNYTFKSCSERTRGSHPPVVYGVSGSMVHRGATILPVHARGRTHPRPHLRRHVAHIRTHPGTIGPRAHLTRAYSTRWHVPIRRPAPLAGHGVYGAAHAGATGIVGVGHPRVAWLPGVPWTWQEMDKHLDVLLHSHLTAAYCICFVCLEQNGKQSVDGHLLNGS